jgi:pimeloyl-ACP methyl ester carboxylesterase
MKKSIRIAAVVLAAAGLLAYRAWHGKPSDTARAATSQGHYVVESGTRAFTFGRLQFKACELPQKHSAATTAAFCAPFEVPENWDAPDGRRIALRLALIASEEAADDDFIVLLAGGPGQSAVDSWPQAAAAFAPAARRRHVLLLDQRGTGESHALTCAAEDEDQDKAFDLAVVRERARTCLSDVSKNADPRYYTTTMAVRDLEALREALGSPRFDLIGISYGTRVAQQYLMRHADGVRSIVLDSPAPNSLALGAEFARNLDDALKKQFAVCTKDAACAKAFGDDPYASLLRLRDALHAEPKQVSFQDPVTFATARRRLDGEGLAGLVRMFAYAPETAALIPLAVREATRGDYAPLMGQMKIVADGVGELAGSGMQMSVICSEDVDRFGVDPAAASLLGLSIVEAMRAQCEIWPHGTRPADFTQPASGDTPVLVLSGEFDPVTPPRYGEEIVRHLGNARQIVAKGQGHNVIGRGCLPKVVGRFLDTLAPRDLDAACVDALGPTPAFIDYSGAAP